MSFDGHQGEQESDGRMSKATIGVDPGAWGGFAFTRLANRAEVYPMPMVGKEVNLEQIKEWTKHWILMWGGEWHAWIEESLEVGYKPADPACHACQGTGKVHVASFKSRPCPCRTHQGLHATGRLLHSAGLVEGCLRTLGIECTRIPAPAWQSVMLGLKRAKEPIAKHRAALKAASIATARRLFPDVNFKRTSRCTTFSDGMTDSALIAVCGSRMTVV